MTLQRKGSKKGNGVSFCHYCGKQLQYKVGGGFYFTELRSPGDGYPVRVHMTICTDAAKEDGYKLPPGNSDV